MQDWQTMSAAHQSGKSLWSENGQAHVLWQALTYKAQRGLG